MMLDKKSIIKVFDTPDLMSVAAAEFIVQIARESIGAREKFIVALSGGSTPAKLYSLLSSSLFQDQIEWKRVFLFWGDERCVPTDDKRNNAHMAKLQLLDKIEILSENINPIPTQMQPAEAATVYEKTLKNFFGNDAPCFDLILLGLGENGHTASLFPGTPVIHESTHWVKEVYVDEQKEWRITMTVPVINQARNIIFLVAGKEKAQIFERVVNGPLQADKYPAQLIKCNTGNLYWFVDKAAALAK